MRALPLALWHVGADFDRCRPHLFFGNCRLAMATHRQAYAKKSKHQVEGMVAQHDQWSHRASPMDGS